MSGFTANMIARYKPGCQIIGCTLDEKVYRQLNLLWGVTVSYTHLQGIQNLEEIINVADGIMVARGDMGVEIPLEEVPIPVSYTHLDVYKRQALNSYKKPRIQIHPIGTNFISAVPPKFLM